MSKHNRQTDQSRVITLRPGADFVEAMRQLQARDGITPSEQIRRALVPFLTEKGFPPGGRTATPRKGSRRPR